MRRQQLLHAWVERPATLDTIAMPAVPGGLPSELLTRRPDILQAEQVLVAANASIGAVRAQYFPRISLTSLLGLASTSLGGLFSGSARTWSFAGEIAGPIYTGGGLEAATAQVLARREQAFAGERVVAHHVLHRQHGAGRGLGRLADGLVR